MNVIKKITAVLAISVTAAVSFSCATLGAEYSTKNYECTDFITHEQFDRILSTMREYSWEDTSGATTQAHYTGIPFTSIEDAEKIINSYYDLYMGYDRYVLFYLSEAPSSVEITNVVFTDNSKDYSIVGHYGSSSSSPAGIYFAWLSGSDPETSLHQHDEASARLQEIISAAPADDHSFYQYIFEWLCRHSAYDYSHQRISSVAYGPLINGSGVCAGYTRAFMSACFAASNASEKSEGRKCYYVSCIVDGEHHAENVVFDNNVPKWIDSTNGDQGTWIDYSYFLRDLDDHWNSFLFQEPYIEFH